jgi:hypothetical protein
VRHDRFRLWINGASRGRRVATRAEASFGAERAASRSLRSVQASRSTPIGRGKPRPYKTGATGATEKRRRAAALRKKKMPAVRRATRGSLRRTHHRPQACNLGICVRCSCQPRQSAISRAAIPGWANSGQGFASVVHTESSILSSKAQGVSKRLIACAARSAISSLQLRKEPARAAAATWGPPLGPPPGIPLAQSR